MSYAPPASAVRDAVARAVAEDLLPLGDLTSSLIPRDAAARGALVARERGVLAGRSCGSEVFAQVAPEVALRWALDDGDDVEAGVEIATLDGPLAQMLSAERVALNFLCHLSGVATLTRAYAVMAADANPATRVWDTRKTLPGLRALQKAAVRAGAGLNHRGSLSDGILVKDNHLAGMGITAAVGAARERWPGRLVEVECESVEQVEEALAAGATMVLCDNMDPARVRECVALARAARPPVPVEVSGGVTLATVAAYAEAGADLISVGALTQSAPALDIGLDLEGTG